MTNGIDPSLDLRHALVDTLTATGALRDKRVAEAFLAVPRHLFVPHVSIEEAYQDNAIPVKKLVDRWISSSSQPSIMAIMLEQLDLQPGQRVLEIGAATGYNAALMAHLVGPTGHVTTLDIDDDLVAGAREHLSVAGVPNVDVVCADGGYGYPDGASYDRIILTVGAWDIAPAWWDQLASTGRLVLPLSARVASHTIAFEQTGEYLTSASVHPCGFMQLRGVFAGPDTLVGLGSDPGLLLHTDDTTRVNAKRVYTLLKQSHVERPSGFFIKASEIWRNATLGLALHEPGFCTLTAQGDLADSELAPALLRWEGTVKSAYTFGVLEETGIVLFARPGGASASDDPFELILRGYGDSAALADRIVQRLATLDAADRPGIEGLRVRAYRQPTTYIPVSGEAVVDKRYTRLVFDWPLADD